MTASKSDRRSTFALMARKFIPLALAWLAMIHPAVSQQVPIIPDVPMQPFKAQIKRIVESLKFLGEPLTKKEMDELKKALESEDDKSVTTIQQILDKRVIALVNINPESRVKVGPGKANKQLVQNGWSVFLVKVQNEAGVTAPLKVFSPNAAPVQKRSTGSPDPAKAIKKSDVIDRWCDVAMFDNQPMMPTLSGLSAEYRIVQIYSRDAGKREAGISFNVGQGTQDIGFRNEVAILFNCQPGVKVVFDVIDHDGKPTTGQFVIRDARGRVYPAKSKRLAPDFFFHDQIYRHSGESVTLSPGTYNVSYSRGPEYRILNKRINVPAAKEHRETFRLVRWIKATDFDWYSGDHHVHAAGCSHYESPTEGVTPEHMMRHIWEKT